MSALSYTPLDVRASGQAALIPLGAHRVCSTLPTGVWLLNCPVAVVDVEGRDLAQLPMCGRILRRIPAAGFRIGHTQRRAATVRPFCSRGEAWSALTECSTESASGPGPSAAMCILQRPVQNVAEEWPFRPRVPASAALRLRSGRDPPSREAVTVLVARTRLGSSGRILPALQRTGQFGAV